jgi:8-oxo-dGTP diphosphatase
MAFAPLMRLPRGALVLLKEVARHLLRRPVVGIAAAARTRDGRWVLIRRADTGTWATPGGTLEWGETMQTALARELLEEAGIENAVIERVVGVYSRPDRDPRFHAVTVMVVCAVDAPTRPPVNPLEILEVGIFDGDALPRPLALAQDDMMDAALRGDAAIVE